MNLVSKTLTINGVPANLENSCNEYQLSEPWQQ